MVLVKNTISEDIFELFCNNNNVACRRVPVANIPTPDYEIAIGSDSIYVEIKQIDLGDSGKIPGRSSDGKQICSKIHEARKQAQSAASAEKPFVLLVYNNADRFQLQGTEHHEFLTGMHGRFVLNLYKDGQQCDSYYDKDGGLNSRKNTSFSGIGHLSTISGTPKVKVYTNPYAKNILRQLPECFEVVNVEIDRNDLK